MIDSSTQASAAVTVATIMLFEQEACERLAGEPLVEQGVAEVAPVPPRGQPADRDGEHLRLRLHGSQQHPHERQQKNPAGGRQQHGVAEHT